MFLYSSNTSNWSIHVKHKWKIMSRTIKILFSYCLNNSCEIMTVQRDEMYLGIYQQFVNNYYSLECIIILTYLNSRSVSFKICYSNCQTIRDRWTPYSKLFGANEPCPCPCPLYENAQIACSSLILNIIIIILISTYF